MLRRLAFVWDCVESRASAAVLNEVATTTTRVLTNTKEWDVCACGRGMLGGPGLPIWSE